MCTVGFGPKIQEPYSQASESHIMARRHFFLLLLALDGNTLTFVDYYECAGRKADLLDPPRAYPIPDSTADAARVFLADQGYNATVPEVDKACGSDSWRPRVKKKTWKRRRRYQIGS